jgi:HD-like signal output (HDOD) protein
MATEKEIFGLNHCETGFRLGQSWSFPDSLTTVIQHHHYPEAAQEYGELTHIVYLADLLMSRFHTGLEIERMNTELLGGRLETLNLPPSRFQELVDLIPSSVFTTEDAPDVSG